jgi:type VI protein secretion system component Hcp
MGLSSSSSPLGNQFRWVATMCVGYVVILSAMPVQAQYLATAGYFQCTNTDGANLNDGDSTVIDRTDWGELISLLEPAQVQMNQDGSSPGAFEHGGITIVKQLSKSSVRYMDAMYQKTILDSCVIEIGYPNESALVVTYTLELTNARVGQIAVQGSGDVILEEITFHAFELNRTWTDENVTSSQILGTPP